MPIHPRTGGASRRRSRNAGTAVPVTRLWKRAGGIAKVIADWSSTNPVPVPPTPGPGVDFTRLWKSPQLVDQYVAANPTLARIADQPHAIWAGDWESTSTVQGKIAGYMTSAAGRTVALVLYAIPQRDNGGDSSGGFSTHPLYLAWIDKVAAGIGSAPCAVILEPDALGHVNDLGSTANRDARYASLKAAVGKLKAGAGTQVYLDMGMWVGAADAAQRLISAGVGDAAGFSINVSAFNTQAACYAYGDALVAELARVGVTGKQYVVDSSRNGNGPLTSADGALATPWIDANKAWMNPPKRGLGLNPGVVSGHAGCAATLWVKNPGGSDGNSPVLTASTGNFVSNYYGESAPPAGTYWVKSGLDYVANTKTTTSTTTAEGGSYTDSYAMPYGPTTTDPGTYPAATGGT